MTIRPRSLVVTLTLWYVLILAVLIASAGLLVYRSFESRLLEEVDQSVRGVGGEIWRDWSFTRGRSWAEAIDGGERRHEGLGVTAMVVALGENGEPIPEKTIGSGRRRLEGLLLTRPDYMAAETDDGGRPLLARVAAGKPWRIGLFDMRGPYVLQVSMTLEPTEARLRQLALLLTLGGVVLLAFASLGGGFIVRRALGPVGDVVRAARAMSAEDLSHRIAGADRRDEIGDLVTTFNDMLSRLELSVDKIKQFTADVSHELRTPLTIIRGEIEVGLRRERTAEAYRETLESVLGEAQSMGQLIDDLLLLSRLDASKHAGPGLDVALDEVLLRTFERLEPLARAKALRFEVSEAKPAVVRGDDRLLDRLVSNLVDNAIRHTPANGRVELSVTTANDASTVLRVGDTGMGIPPEALPRVFERFYVADPSRSRETGGAGLGLSIVKSVADLHGAIVAVDSQIGRGTTVEVRFPAGVGPTDASPSR